jgi:peptidoglycan/LPS O-acetylase OafA/YrhL
MDYRREIDGLRGFAVIPVILFHAGFQTFSGGYVGVDIFFVISGYLITSIILTEKQAGTFRLVDFYERRARRVLPALFLVMLVCIPFAWSFFTPKDLKQFSQSIVAVSFFASNIEFFRSSDYFDSASELKPLLHTWSLAIEEQYYLIFPIFMIVTWKLGRNYIFGILLAFATVSLMLAQWGVVTEPKATFYLLPTRAWELLIGAFVAFYLSVKEKPNLAQTTSQVGSSCGFLLVTYAILVFDKHVPFPSLYTLIPTVGTALIILCTTQHTVVGKILGNKLLVGVGLISYSAYLWHQPIFAFAKYRSEEAPSKSLLSVLAIAAIALAYLSWKYVESPFRNKQRYSRRQVFQYGTVLSTCFVAIGLTGYLSNGVFFREADTYFPINYLQTVSAVRNPSVGIDGRPCGSRKAIICEISLFNGAKNFLLVGDSHASDFSVEFRKFVNNRKFSSSQLTVPGCGYMMGHSPQIKNKGECGKAISLLEEALRNKKFDVVIFIGAFYGHAENSSNSTITEDMDSLSSLISLMTDTSGEVWLFTPRYSLSSDPIQAGMFNRLSKIHVDKESSISLVDEHFNRFLSFSNLKIFNARDYLVELGGQPISKFNGHTLDYEPMYTDTNHLTGYGAKLVFDKFLSTRGGWE